MQSGRGWRNLVPPGLDMRLHSQAVCKIHPCFLNFTWSTNPLEPHLPPKVLLSAQFPIFSMASVHSYPPCPDCGRDFPLRTSLNCGHCQLRETHGVACELSYCLLCGVVFKYLEGSHCSTCSNSPLALALKTSQTSHSQASVNPAAVQGIDERPVQSFQAPFGVPTHQQALGQPPVPNTMNPNDLPPHMFMSNTGLPPPPPFPEPGGVSSTSTEFCSRQAEELARLLTSKNQTNYPKPPINKAVLHPTPSQVSLAPPAPKGEGKMKMVLWYMKDSRRTQNPIDLKRI